MKLLSILILLVLLVSCRTSKSNKVEVNKTTTTKTDTIIKHDSSFSYARIDSTVKIPQIITDGFIHGLPNLPNGIEVVVKNDSNTTITIIRTDTVYKIRTIIKERLGKVVKIVSTASNTKIDTIKRSNIDKLFTNKETKVTPKSGWELNWWFLILAILILLFFLYITHR